MLREEPGGTKVAGTIASARMSSVNFAEVVSHFIHIGTPAVLVDDMIRPLPVVIVPADAALVRMAGRLRSVTAEGGDYHWVIGFVSH